MYRLGCSGLGANHATSGSGEVTLMMPLKPLHMFSACVQQILCYVCRNVHIASYYWYNCVSDIDSQWIAFFHTSLISRLFPSFQCFNKFSRACVQLSLPSHFEEVRVFPVLAINRFANINVRVYYNTVRGQPSQLLDS